MQQNHLGIASTMNGVSEQANAADIKSQVCTPQKAVEEPKPVRADPMSFSSILSSTVVEPPKTVVKQESTPKQNRRSSKTPNGDVTGSGVNAMPPTTSARKSSYKSSHVFKDESIQEKRVKDAVKPRHSKVIPSSKPVPTTSDKENEEITRALDEINSMQHSDIESPEWNDAKERHRILSQKRQLEVEDGETGKRKVCWASSSSS